MRTPEKGMFARSIAGHDKGRLYINLQADERSLLLTDGKTHPYDRPKKKNRLHVQPDMTQSHVFDGDVHPDQIDAELRKAIKNKEGGACQKQMS